MSSGYKCDRRTWRSITYYWYLKVQYVIAAMRLSVAGSSILQAALAWHFRHIAAADSYVALESANNEISDRQVSG
jgi:hypothetical protein